MMVGKRLKEDVNSVALVMTTLMWPLRIFARYLKRILFQPLPSFLLSCAMILIFIRTWFKGTIRKSIDL